MSSISDHIEAVHTAPVAERGASARTMRGGLGCVGLALLTLLAPLAAFLVVAAWFALSYYCFTPAGVAGDYCTWVAQRLGILGIAVAGGMLLEWSLPPGLVLGFLSALLFSRRAQAPTRLLIQVVVGMLVGVFFLALFFLELRPG